MEADKIIEFLGLEPLKEEGGWYQRSYTSGFTQGGDSAMGTAIYYLLKAGEISALHRIFCDELFHFYYGDVVEMFTIDPVSTEGIWINLGNQLFDYQFPQYLVPAGNWQGMRLKDGGSDHGFALMGCTVVPGFEWDKFELGKKSDLMVEYPDHEHVIQELTRS